VQDRDIDFLIKTHIVGTALSIGFGIKAMQTAMNNVPPKGKCTMTQENGEEIKRRKFKGLSLPFYSIIIGRQLIVILLITRGERRKIIANIETYKAMCRAPLR
jgi:hypothetical protein